MGNFGFIIAAAEVFFFCGLNSCTMSDVHIKVIIELCSHKNFFTRGLSGFLHQPAASGDLG